MKKLAGVGPVDNRPSTDWFHPFDQKKIIIKKKNVTFYMGHVTCDM